MGTFHSVGASYALRISSPGVGDPRHAHFGEDPIRFSGIMPIEILPIPKNLLGRSIISLFSLSLIDNNKRLGSMQDHDDVRRIGNGSSGIDSDQDKADVRKRDLF